MNSHIASHEKTEKGGFLDSVKPININTVREDRPFKDNPSDTL